MALKSWFVVFQEFCGVDRYGRKDERLYAILLKYLTQDDIQNIKATAANWEAEFFGDLPPEHYDIFFIPYEGSEASGLAEHAQRVALAKETEQYLQTITEKSNPVYRYFNRLKHLARAMFFSDDMLQLPTRLEELHLRFAIDFFRGKDEGRWKTYDEFYWEMYSMNPGYFGKPRGGGDYEQDTVKKILIRNKTEAKRALESARKSVRK